MTVKELINELKKCNPDDLVLYDPSNAIKNENGGVSPEFVDGGVSPEFVETYCIDDVLIGSGTIKGFVYLTEELL